MIWFADQDHLVQVRGDGDARSDAVRVVRIDGARDDDCRVRLPGQSADAGLEAAPGGAVHGAVLRIHVREQEGFRDGLPVEGNVPGWDEVAAAHAGAAVVSIAGAGYTKGAVAAEVVAARRGGLGQV